MGSYTYTALVPFAARYLWAGDYLANEMSTFIKVAETEPESWREVLEELWDKDLPVDFDPTPEFKGWSWSEAPKDPAKHGNVYATCWVKGEHAVFFINESPYQAGGELNLTAYSESKEALQEIIADLFPEIDGSGYAGKIEKDVIVQQTL
jgi:hypothetical protein